MYAYVGGIPEWTTFNYPMTIDEKWQSIKVNKIAPSDFLALLKQQDIVLLDIRPLEFREKTFIKGAILCPLIFLEELYHEIPKDRRILLSDIVMKQSPSAAKFLLSKGYRVEGVLKGGIERWKEEKLPTERREPPVTIKFLNIPRQNR